MCGIMGYVGPQPAITILYQGLKHLEHRGYDSAGIAVIADSKQYRWRCEGSVDNLYEKIKDISINTHCGIAHNRWATHGPPVIKNAHPHMDDESKIALVHNGIIENEASLRASLIERDYPLTSDTDTELICALISEFYEGDLRTAVRLTLPLLKGTWGLVVSHQDEPTTLVVARRSSPIVVGFLDGETFVASDLAAIHPHTKKLIYLKDGEIATLKAGSIDIENVDKKKIPQRIEWLETAWTAPKLRTYPSFMLQEIYEQPEVLKNALRGRIHPQTKDIILGGISDISQQLLSSTRIIITGCGSSWHAALVGQYLIESLARIPVTVEYASELRYRDPVLGPGDVLIGISQSGETADTMAAIEMAKAKGALSLGITNVVGSTISHETDYGIHTYAGTEIGVAATKTFVAQLAVMTLLALFLAQKRKKNLDRVNDVINALCDLPKHIQHILTHSKDTIEKIASIHSYTKHALYLGRGVNFPIALEGALKLKEISYIHAEGYPAAEMKHGPIALIDQDMPVVIIGTSDPSVYVKMLGNVAEIRARKGKIIAITDKYDSPLCDDADVIYVPQTDWLLSPIANIIPLQLLSHEMATIRGNNVDRPRNLAKTVTVE